MADATSLASTQGIFISVRSRYLPEQSSPATRCYTFVYTVRIENRGSSGAQLVSRHWVISDAHGHVEDVRGSGVVGQKPLLNPGGVFEYTSGCRLKTARGAMHGSYRMLREDGSSFDAEIAPFDLLPPLSLN